MATSRFLQAALLMSAAIMSVGETCDPHPQGTRLPSSASPTAQSRIWAALSVSSPLVRGEEVNVTFAATNLGNVPIPMRAVREDTVLVINGEEWKDSHFTFENGPHACDPGKACELAPGESTMFNYQLTDLFKDAGVYRLVWKGNGFESLPIEFRVVR